MTNDDLPRLHSQAELRSPGPGQPRTRWMRAAAPVAGLPAEVHEVSLAGGGHTLPLLLPAKPEALLDDPGTLKRHAVDSFMPYWATLWPGAIALAEHLIEHQPWLDNGPGIGDDAVQVHELGCGLALCSVVAGRLGARVVCSDYDDTALAFAQASAKLGGVSLTTTYLDWFQLPEEPALSACRSALLIGSDLFYETRLAAGLISVAKGLMPPGGRFIVSTPQRQSLPAVLQAWRGAGFAVSTRDQRTVATGDDAAPVVVDIMEIAHD